MLGSSSGCRQRSSSSGCFPGVQPLPPFQQCSLCSPVSHLRLVVVGLGLRYLLDGVLHDVYTRAAGAVGVYCNTPCNTSPPGTPQVPKGITRRPTCPKHIPSSTILNSTILNITPTLYHYYKIYPSSSTKIYNN